MAADKLTDTAIRQAKPGRRPAAGQQAPPCRAIVEPKATAELLRALDGYTGGLVTACTLKLAPLTLCVPASCAAPSGRRSTRTPPSGVSRPPG